MEITTKTIILAFVSVVIIALILSGIFYLLRNSKNLANSSKNSGNPLSGLGIITNNPTPTPNPANNQGAQAGTNITKTYQGKNFTLKYPQNWGLLTCSDSQNIELDPYHSADQLNFSCNRAIKPITILVSESPLSCPGESVKIGNNTVTRSKTETANWFKNRWCLSKNGVSLDITNRINAQGITGTGKDDFSQQIEQIISSI